MRTCESDPATTLAAFEGRARRFATACGEGSLVWRSWGSGPPALLAHGSHGSWSHWIRNIKALAQVRTLWVPDSPVARQTGHWAMYEQPEEFNRTVIDLLSRPLRQA